MAYMRDSERKRRQVGLDEPDGPELQFVANRIRESGTAARFNLEAAAGRKPSGHSGLNALARIARVESSFVSHMLKRELPHVPRSAAKFLRLAKALGVRPEVLLPPDWLVIDEVAKADTSVDDARSLADESDQEHQQQAPRLPDSTKRSRKRRRS